MGAIHCPMGAAFYDDEGCIDCGLCSAVTKEEMIEASKKIPSFRRQKAYDRWKKFGDEHGFTGVDNV